MKSKKVYLWADASKEIGYGHFIRTLALADILKENFECIFFTQSPTEYQKLEVEKVCQLIILPSGEDKFTQFLNTLHGDEIVFLDNYFFTSVYQKQIKEKGCKLVCIGPPDRHYFADLIINYISTDPDRFSAEPYSRFRLGMDWVILRKPFLHSYIKNTHSGPHEVIVSFGGTDQYHITEKVVSILQTLKQILKIHIIATDILGAERIARLKNKDIISHINISAVEIADLFTTCDLAILSASTIVQEALACGIPVIAGYYVDNQIGLYNYLCHSKYIQGIGNLLHNDSMEEIENIISEWDVRFKNMKTLNISDIKDRYIETFKSL